jgi:hypothetical protein
LINKKLGNKTRSVVSSFFCRQYLRRNNMSESIMAEISKQYRNTHENLLHLVATLTDEQIDWTANETTPSIGFHVWHLARWADYLQEMINGRGSQLWEKEELAAQWNMETASLGYAQTGMSMDDKTAVTLRIPGKELLLDYTRRAFAAAQRAVEGISDKEFYRVYEGLHGENWHDGHIGPIISTWMTHDNRHLGMIECLIGVQGIHGSADS